MRDIKGFDDSFMKPEIEEGFFFEVTDIHGYLTVIPACLVGDDPDPYAFKDYMESTYPVHSSKRVKGFGARLSAPGYLDATEWNVFPTEEEAIAYLEETYGDFEEEETDNRCSDCSAMVINGVYCHEEGCPNKEWMPDSFQ